MDGDHQTSIPLSGGDGTGVPASELFPLVYERLRAMAARQLARERLDHTLQPTALVNEAYLKLVDQTRASLSDRNHFLAIAAEAMRRILVDHARKKQAEKRGGDRSKVQLDSRIPADEDLGAQVDLIDLSEAMDRLAQLDDRARRVVELRYFAGFTKEETAEILGVSRATVGNDWSFARTWLKAEISRQSKS